MKTSAILRKSLVCLLATFMALLMVVALVPALLPVEAADEATQETGTPAAQSTATAIDDKDQILHADGLKAGVQAYFTDEDGNVTAASRTNFTIENKLAAIKYALSATQAQQITALENKAGVAYISGTSDVFVTMDSAHGGKTYYASDSGAPALANIHRFGDYYYEAKLEGQSFSGNVGESGSSIMSGYSKTQQMKNVSTEKEGGTFGYGGTVVSVTGTLDFSSAPEGSEADPQVHFDVKSSSLQNGTYQYVAITMSTDDTAITRTISVYINGVKPAYSATYSPSLEGSTVYVPLGSGDGLTGIKSVRVDLPYTEDAEGTTYTISSISLVESGAPAYLQLSRSLNVYSDKIHQVIQVASSENTTEGIAAIGVQTKVSASSVYIQPITGAPVTSIAANGSVDNVAYAGFMTSAGVFGYILPNDQTDSLSVSYDGSVYTITQSRQPQHKNWVSGELTAGTIHPVGTKTQPTGWTDGVRPIYPMYYDAQGNVTKVMTGNTKIPDNSTDFYMGQRLYTGDTSDTSFAKFIAEAEAERNPLTSGFTVDADNSTVTSTEVTYNSLRGHYQLDLQSTGFNNAYYLAQNKKYNARFTVVGDELDRDIYVLANAVGTGDLESAVLLNKDDMLLPINIEVGKNFSETEGERNLWNVNDIVYGEAIVPLTVAANSTGTYNFVHLYQSWGNFPLKQISWIQYVAPYYHLSAGVVETNCIMPWYFTRNNTRTSLAVLPDHRTMSGELWNDQPQHTNAGSHSWLQYVSTASDGATIAAENIKNTIESYGPVYSSVKMDYVTDDGKLNVSYTHTELPQTDENRGFYEVTYTANKDLTINDILNNLTLYTVAAHDTNGMYRKLGYLDENGESRVVDTVSLDTSVSAGGSKTYLLGETSPYFSTFYMDGGTLKATGANYSNSSFIIYDSDFSGISSLNSVAPRFAIVNKKYETPISAVAGSIWGDTTPYGDGDRYKNSVRLTLDLDGNISTSDTLTLKAGESFSINVMVNPWGDQHNFDAVQNMIDPSTGKYSTSYTAEQIADAEAQYLVDTSVRNVRLNTCIKPLKATAIGSDAEDANGVFIPGVKSANGTSAEFTLSGGYNNVAVRVEGFNTLTVPVIEEYVNGKWVEYTVSSASNVDASNSGHYYDGYAVYYDKATDTYTYAFVVDMTYDMTGMTDANKDSYNNTRSFRVTASEEFTGWSDEEIKGYWNNVNGIIPASELLYKAGPYINRMSISELKTEGETEYITLTANAGIDEAYFEVYKSGLKSGVGVTPYVALKYRIPEGTRTTSAQIYTRTVDGKDQSYDNPKTSNLYFTLQNDGEWHVIAIDLSAIPHYTAGQEIYDLRFDFFNGNSNALADGSEKIDLAYFALLDDVNDLSSLCGEGATVEIRNTDGTYGTEVVHTPGLSVTVTKEQVEAAIRSNKSIKIVADAVVVMPANSSVVIESNGKNVVARADLSNGEQKIKIFDNGDGKSVTVVSYLPFENEEGNSIGMNLGIKSNIRMIVKFPERALQRVLNDDDNSAYLEVTIPQRNAEPTVARYYRASLERLLNNGKYEISASVAQAQQTDWVTFQIVDGDQRGLMRRYSVRSYADRVFELSNSTTAYNDIIEPVKQMLNAGAHAQAALGYNTDNLANKGLYDDGTNPVTDMTVNNLYGYDHSTVKKAVSGNALKAVSYEVELETNAKLVMYVNYTGTGSLTATVRRSDESIASEADVYEYTGTETGFTHYVEVSNIPIHMYDKVYTVTVTDGTEANTAVFEKSVLNYVGDVLSSPAASALKKNAVSGMYLNYTWLKNYVTKADYAANKITKNEIHIPGPSLDRLTDKGYSACSHSRKHMLVTVQATCTVAGEKKQICSDCGYVFEKNTTVIDQLSHNYVLISAIPETCTEAGTPEHYKCSNCGTLSLDGVNATDNIGTSGEATGHILKKVEAVSTATCVTPTMTEHYACSVCGQLYTDETGNTVASYKDIYGEIDADAHDFGTNELVDMKAPYYDSDKGTPVVGHTAYKTCTLCGKDEGKVTLYYNAKTDNLNIHLGPDALLSSYNIYSGDDKADFVASTAVKCGSSTDGFLSITQTEAGDLRFYPIHNGKLTTGVDTASGGYLVLKIRVNGATADQRLKVYARSTANLAEGQNCVSWSTAATDGNNYNQSEEVIFTTDFTGGDWRTVVVNLAKAQESLRGTTEGQRTPGLSASEAIEYLCLRLENLKAYQTVDIAYVGITDTFEKATRFAGSDGYTSTVYDASDLDGAAAEDDVTVLQETIGDKTFDYAHFEYTFTASTDENDLKELQLTLRNNIDTIKEGGRYVAVLARRPADSVTGESGSIEVYNSAHYGIVINGVAAPSHSVASSSLDNQIGQWVYTVLDYSASTNEVCADDTFFRSLRVDVFNPDFVDADFTAQVDIAFIGVFQTKTEADRYFTENYGDILNSCMANGHTYTLRKNADSTHTEVCSVCGAEGKTDTCTDTITRNENGTYNHYCECGNSMGTTPINVLLDAEGITKADTTINVTGITVETDQTTGKSFASVAVERTTASSAEFYMRIWSKPGNSTVETGKYMIIKYRVGAGLVTGSTKDLPTYASTVHDGQDANDYIPDSSSIQNDGEWHILIQNVEGASNKGYFMPADDGKYYCNYIRLGLAGIPTEGSYDFDIEYFGLCDDLGALSDFIAAKEGENAAIRNAAHKHIARYTAEENSLTHTRTCAICNAAVGGSANEFHTFNRDKLTKAADGGYTGICTVCGYEGKSLVNTYFISGEDLYGTLPYSDNKTNSENSSADDVKKLDPEEDLMYAHISGGGISEFALLSVSANDPNGIPDTGRYLVLRYRQPAQTTGGGYSLWAATKQALTRENGVHSLAGGSVYVTAANYEDQRISGHKLNPTDGYLKYNAATKDVWKIAVIDLDNNQNANDPNPHGVIEIDGTYDLRMIAFRTENTKTQIDISFAATVRSLEEYKELLTLLNEEGLVSYCDTIHGDGHTWNSDGYRLIGDTQHSAVCAICGSGDEKGAVTCIPGGVDYVNKNGQAVTIGYDSVNKVYNQGVCECGREFKDPINVVFSGSELKDAGQRIGTIASELDADGNLVLSYSNNPYESNETNKQWYFGAYLNKAGNISTGQYLVVKYKTSGAIGFSSNLTIHASTQATDASGASSGYIGVAGSGFKDDGQWHIALIDLGSLPAAHAPSGATQLKHIRIACSLTDAGWTNWSSGNVTFTIAYVGICDSVENLSAYLESVENTEGTDANEFQEICQHTYKTYASHNAGTSNHNVHCALCDKVTEANVTCTINEATWNAENQRYDIGCGKCHATVYTQAVNREAEVFLDAVTIANKTTDANQHITGTVGVDSANNETYATVKLTSTDGDKDRYVNIKTGLHVKGRYLVVKYRVQSGKTLGDTGLDFLLYVSNKNGTGSAGWIDDGANYITIKTSTPDVWQYKLLDLTKFSYDEITQIRTDFHEATESAAGDEFDIAWIAVFSDQDTAKQTFCEHTANRTFVRCEEINNVLTDIYSCDNCHLEIASGEHTAHFYKSVYNESTSSYDIKCIGCNEVKYSLPIASKPTLFVSGQELYDLFGTYQATEAKALNAEMIGSESDTFVKFSATTTSELEADRSLYFFKNNTETHGKYVVIKFSGYTSDRLILRGATALDIHFANFGYPGYYAYTLNSENASSARVNLFWNTAASGLDHRMEIAWVAFYETENAARQAYCTHEESKLTFNGVTDGVENYTCWCGKTFTKAHTSCTAGNAVYNASRGGYVIPCAKCGADVEFYAIGGEATRFVSATELKAIYDRTTNHSKLTAQLLNSDTSDITVKFSSATTSDGNNTYTSVNFLAGNADTIGKYLVIKYRNLTGETRTIFWQQNGGVEGSLTSNSSEYLYKQITLNADNLVQPYMSLFWSDSGKASAIDGNLEIAWAAFFTTEAAAKLAACDHSEDNWTWTSYADGVDTFTCSCGKTFTKTHKCDTLLTAGETVYSAQDGGYAVKCSVCNETIFVQKLGAEATVFFSATDLYDIYKTNKNGTTMGGIETELVGEGNDITMKVTANSTSGGRYLYLFANNTATHGKYFAMKYKNASGTTRTLFTNYDSTGTQKNPEYSPSTTLGTDVYGYTTGTLSNDKSSSIFLRLFWERTGSYEIAWIAFFETEEERTKALCSHDESLWSFTSTSEGTDTFTCSCGTVFQRAHSEGCVADAAVYDAAKGGYVINCVSCGEEMYVQTIGAQATKFISGADIYKAVKSQSLSSSDSVALSATLIEQGEDISVEISAPIGAEALSPNSFILFDNNTEVQGNYVVVKFRNMKAGVSGGNSIIFMMKAGTKTTLDASSGNFAHRNFDWAGATYQYHSFEVPSTVYTNNSASENVVTGIRCCMFWKKTSENNSMEIAWIGFFDSAEAANAAAGATVFQ